MNEAKVIRRGNALLLEINGEILPPVLYTSYNPDNADYENFKDAGTRLFELSVYAGDKGINPGSGIKAFRRNFWVGERQFDFEQCKKDMEKVIGSSKPGEIYIIPRIMLNTPDWWEDKFPEQLARNYSGSPCFQSFCSEKWIEDCKEVLQAFQDWLCQSGLAPYVAGWHLAAGNTEEFFYPRVEQSQYLDYSSCAVRAFKKWCKEKYNDLDRVNEAWGENYSSFDEIELPTPFERTYFPYGKFRDAVKERKLIDFYQFHSNSYVEAILKISRAAKEILNWKQIIGVFYGYTAIASPYMGHNAMDKLLKCKEVDFFASPFAYASNRSIGIDWYFTGSVQSAQKADKIWFMEGDIRTYLSQSLSESMPWAAPVDNNAYETPLWFGADSIESSKWDILRSFARVLMHQAGVWWFDMWGGWYNNEEFMALHKLQNHIYNTEMKKGKMKSAAQVVVFVDERLAFYCDEHTVLITEYLSNAMIECGSDVENSIEIGLKGGNGIVVICGTGSILFVKQDKILHRMGGYGYLFDDGCSGYAFGNAAILAALRANDGSGKPTLMLELINKRLGKSVLASLSTIYQKGKRYIASLSDIVFEAYRMGDKMAAEIIDKNVSYIAELIKVADEKYCCEKRIALTGGIFTNELFLLDKLKGMGLSDYNIYIVNERPVIGAVRIATRIER